MFSYLALKLFYRVVNFYVVMKKIFSFILASFVLISAVDAQTETFQKGSVVMDLSVGTPTSSHTDNREVIVPPVTLTLDFGGPSGFIKSKGRKGSKKSSKSKGKGKGAFGFGAIVGFYADDCWGWDNYWHDGHYYRYDGWYDANVYNFVTAFRFSFHIQPVKSMDIYVGLLTGGRFRFWDYADGYDGYYYDYYDYSYYHSDDPVGHKFCFGPFTGIRYYFGKVFGLKAEFSADTGSGFPNASVGLSFKFK